MLPFLERLAQFSSKTGKVYLPQTKLLSNRTWPVGHKDMYSPTLHEAGSTLRLTPLTLKLIFLPLDSFTSNAADLCNCFAESMTLRAFSSSVLFVVSGPVMLKLRSLKDTLQEILLSSSMISQSCIVRSCTALEGRSTELFTFLMNANVMSCLKFSLS